MKFDLEQTNALGPRGIELLFEGALKIEDRERRALAALSVLVFSRLGVRLHQFLHMREAHIDWERGELVVPPYDPCGCRRCWKQAKNKWLRKLFEDLRDDPDSPFDENTNYDVLDVDDQVTIIEKSDLEVEKLEKILYEENLSPKTRASARRIPFGYSERLSAALLFYFKRNDYIDVSGQHIRDLLKEAAVNVAEINDDYFIDPDEVTPHALRSEAITFFAKATGKWSTVRDLAGHSDVRTSNEYIRETYRITTHNLYINMGKEDEAPPVIPRKPHARYPTLLDPMPRTLEPWDPGRDGTEKERLKRAKQIEDESIDLPHPRGEDSPLPDSKSFPSDITYQPRRHRVPGSKDKMLADVDELSVSKRKTLDEFVSPHKIPEKPHRELEEQTQTRIDIDDPSYMSTGFVPIGLMSDGVSRIRNARLSEVLRQPPKRLANCFGTLTTVSDPDQQLRNLEDHMIVGVSLVMVVMLSGIMLADAGIHSSPHLQRIFIATSFANLLGLAWGDLTTPDAGP